MEKRSRNIEQKALALINQRLAEVFEREQVKFSKDSKEWKTFKRAAKSCRQAETKLGE